MIELKNVGFKREEWILRNLTVKFEKGRVYGLIGKSGVGKTTLLKLISGLLDVSEGEVLFNNEQVIGPSVKLIPGYDDIQLVDQDFGLEPFHTVEQNVKEKILSRHKEDQEALIEECLELVDMTLLKHRKARELSGGEQQRLSIARALACEPDFLLLDEPFVHLDQGLRFKIMRNIIHRNTELGMGIIIVSHDGAELMGFAEQLIHVKGVGIDRISSVQEMYYHPNDIEQARLLGVINELTIKGEKIFFRPNEYELSEDGQELNVLDSIDIGLCWLNNCVSKKGEGVVLSSGSKLAKTITVRIKKKYELD